MNFALPEQRGAEKKIREIKKRVILFINAC